MRVRMKALGAGPDGLWPPGTVITVGEGLGRALVEGGYAEELPEEPVTSEEPAVEHAVEPEATARRTATGRAQRKTWKGL